MWASSAEPVEEASSLTLIVDVLGNAAFPASLQIAATYVGVEESYMTHYADAPYESHAKLHEAASLAPHCPAIPIRPDTSCNADRCKD